MKGFLAPVFVLPIDPLVFASLCFHEPFSWLVANNRFFLSFFCDDSADEFVADFAGSAVVPFLVYSPALVHRLPANLFPVVVDLARVYTTVLRSPVLRPFSPVPFLFKTIRVPKNKLLFPGSPPIPLMLAHNPFFPFVKPTNNSIVEYTTVNILLFIVPGATLPVTASAIVHSSRSPVSMH